jgi:hypothetical protein
VLQRALTITPNTRAPVPRLQSPRQVSRLSEQKHSPAGNGLVKLCRRAVLKGPRPCSERQPYALRTDPQRLSPVVRHTLEPWSTRCVASSCFLANGRLILEDEHRLLTQHDDRVLFGPAVGMASMGSCLLGLATWAPESPKFAGKFGW